MMVPMAFTRVSCLVAVSISTAAAQVYFGTYGKGIYRSGFDARTGQLSAPELAAELRNPSFVALAPNGRTLYAVSEAGRQGAVAAFSIDAEGRLTKIGERDSGGAGPCYVAVDRTGRAALVANYGGGTVAALPLDEKGGFAPGGSVVKHSGKGSHPKRQEAPHAHSINLSPDNRFAVAADLGIDKLLVYRFDPKAATLAPNDPPSFDTKPGSGPRHFTFHPNGRFAYVINELASTVTALSWDAKRGALAELQTVSTLPEGFSGESTTAEVVVHPSGKFLYGSNRGHDSIAVFTVDARKGTLTAAGHTPTQGSTPRNFVIDPGGAWLLAANQRSNNVVVFRIDQKTGGLAPAGPPVEVPSPVCIRFRQPLP
jgi:6-phosphogluconolactonase